MIYIVDGDTLTGKTAFLQRQIKEDPQKSAVYFTDEQWMLLVAKCAKEGKTQEECEELLFCEIEKYDIICIDDIDLLHGKTATQTVTATVLARLDGKKQVFLSGIDVVKNLPCMLGLLKERGAAVSFADYRA